MKKKIKVLNLYAGIGGNRKYWRNVEVTAVENNPEIAKIYKSFFPNDNVIVSDAHQYLLEHYNEFDFIWSSPPCQSHSSFMFNIGVRYRGVKPVYPDMTLYQEIIFLKSHATCKWVVENVKPYYVPLIPGKLLQRHLFWSNFELEEINIEKDNIRTAQIPDLQLKYGFDLSKHKVKEKRQVLRNCVEPILGNHIFTCALKSIEVKK